MIKDNNHSSGTKYAIFGFKLHMGKSLRKNGLGLFCSIYVDLNMAYYWKLGHSRSRSRHLIRLPIGNYAIMQNNLCAIFGQSFTMIFIQIMIYYFKQLDLVLSYYLT